MQENGRAIRKIRSSTAYAPKNCGVVRVRDFSEGLIPGPLHSLIAAWTDCCQA